MKLTASAKNKTANIKIIGLIGGYINQSDVFEAKLDGFIADGVKDVKLFIRSQGGDVLEANAIYNAIKKFPGTIKVELGAVCASAGTIIACAGSHISAPRNLLYMVHEPRATSGGTAEQLQSRITMLNAATAEFLNVYAARTGKAKEYISANWKNDWWMSAEDAKREGFIDEILDLDDKLSAQELEEITAEMSIPDQLKGLITKQTNTRNMEKLTLMVAALQMAEITIEANANEDAVLAAVQSMAVAYKAQKEELEKAKQLLDAAALREITSLIEGAINERKITVDQKEHYEKLAKANVESVKAIFASIKPYVPAHVRMNASTGGGANAELSDAEQYEKLFKENPTALAKIQAEDPQRFADMKAAYVKSLRG